MTVMMSRHILKFALLACLALAAVGLASAPARAGLFEALFAPSADLWERWTAHDETNARMLDHSAWDRFLKTYLSQGAGGVTRVAYVKVTQGDRQSLEGYLAALSATPISTHSRNEQRAYWINFYNALTIKVVLDHYPVASIRDIDISPGLFSYGPWGKELVEVEGEQLTLNDIEHRILRPIWRDPRIHYALSCASLGCPNLRAVAFTGANVDPELEDAAREYVNHRRGVSVEGDELIVSSVYLWFREDFGDSDQGVMSHLRRYAAPELRRKLMRFERINDDTYDWKLNDHPIAERKAKKGS